MQFSNLLQPGKIGHMSTRNRMVMAPMATNLHTEEGCVTQRTKDYYEARAKGGVGLIIVEATSIDAAEGRLFNRQLLIDDDKFIPGMRELTEVVHQRGAKAALQLHHPGAVGSSSVTNRQTVAPSAIPYRGYELPRALTEAEIAQLVMKYAQAADRAKRAGFDGVEIHSAHGYLLCEFLFAETNQRQDQYGGSIENRGRFLAEIIRATRKLVGDDYPLWCRIGADAVIEYHSLVEKEGVDAIHITTAMGADILTSIPAAGIEPGKFLPVAATIKKSVSIPVIIAVKMSPELGEEALREGKTDFVAFGKPLIADPELPNKVASGKLNDVRPCIQCMNCLDSLRKGDGDVHCTVNPTLGREPEYEITASPERKKVIVIGGGPAGMEAARVASLRGHEVRLYEMGEELGGQLLLAKLPRYKEPIVDLIDYLARQITQQGVELHMKTRVTLDLIAKKAPDAVLVATGVKPFVPDIIGIDGENVVLACDVLTGTKKIGDDVVVIGGEVTGCEVADLLAEAGKKVTVTTLESDLMTFNVTRYTRNPLLHRLNTMGVTIMTGVQYRKITKDGVTLVDVEGKGQTIKADTVVIAAGTRSDDQLFQSLKGNKLQVIPVGDCIKPRTIMDAMREGYLASFSL